MINIKTVLFLNIVAVGTKFKQTSVQWYRTPVVQISSDMTVIRNYYLALVFVNNVQMFLI